MRTAFPFALAFSLSAARLLSAQPKQDLPAGWQLHSPREEIRPAVSFDPRGGAGKTGAFTLTADNAPGQHGWVQKAVPVVGGKTYLFETHRKTLHVESPRRSTPARIVWLDAAGKPVPADQPPSPGKDDRPVWNAEPEHPLDGETRDGWTTVAGRYRVPTKATQAVIELHLMWAPKGQAVWTEPRFEETQPLPARTVRLATIHHKPSGKSPQVNAEEFAPLIAKAAEAKADLLVLGETVNSVGVGKKPHEVAEPVPGPSSDYFGTLAKKHGLHVVVSLFERDGRAVYNAAVLLDPDGKLIGKYRKVCLPHAEIEAGIAPGSDYPVFDTKIGKVGMMICYDGFFPEVARELTKKGAEVIAWPVWGCDPLLAQARANENRVYVVSSTYMQPKDKWMLSAVYDRRGKPIAAADKVGEVVVAEVDLNAPDVGPYNLGDFRSMVERHRPDPPKAK